MQMIRKFKLSHNPLIFTVKILCRVVFFCPGSKNNNSMVDLSLIHTRSNQDFSCKITLKTGKADNDSLGQNLDLFIRSGLFAQFFKIGFDIRTFNGRMQSVGRPAQAVLLFDQNHLKPLISKAEGGIHPCHSTTDNKGTFIDRNLLFIQLLE